MIYFQILNPKAIILVLNTQAFSAGRLLFRWEQVYKCFSLQIWWNAENVFLKIMQIWNKVMLVYAAFPNARYEQLKTTSDAEMNFMALSCNC